MECRVGVEGETRAGGAKSWGTLLDTLKSLGLRVIKKTPKANNWIRFAF